MIVCNLPDKYSFYKVIPKVETFLHLYTSFLRIGSLHKHQQLA